MAAPTSASTAGSYGSRKGLSVSFPRLTGKAIPLISKNLLDDEHGDEAEEENVLLTGILFCNIWKNNNESTLGSWYDPSFADSRDDQIGCIKIYLRQNNIDEDKIEQLIESSLRQGYITYDPVPFVGKVDIYDVDGKIMSRVDKQDLVDRLYVGDEPGLTSKEMQIEDLLSAIHSADEEKGGGADWNQLIFQEAVQRYDTMYEAEPELELQLRTHDAVSDNLESNIREMIMDEKIIKDGKVIGTVKLVYPERRSPKKAELSGDIIFPKDDITIPEIDPTTEIDDVNSSFLHQAKPGDFVWVFQPGKEKTLFAVRSHPTPNEIRIYPLDNQTLESALIFENAQWNVAGTDEKDYSFELAIYNESLYIGGYPNIYELEDAEGLIADLNTVESIDHAYENLSEYKITPQQFINEVQKALKEHEDAIYITSEPAQIKWMLKHDFVPSEYDLDVMLHIKDFDLFRFG